MRKKLEALDEYLLDHFFERFSHWTQRVFGLNCFFWARLYTVLAIAFVIAAMVCLPLVWPFQSMRALIAAFSFTVGLFSTLGMLLQLKVIQLLERELSRIGTERLANKMRISLQQVRINGILTLVECVVFAVLLRFPLVVGISFFGWFLTKLLADYFVACTPLPPSTSKARELLNSLRRLRFHLPVPVPSHG